MDTFRGDSSVKTWLLRITMNVCKDLRRSFWFRRVWTGKLPERTADDGLPEQQVIEREQNRGLWEQVLDLPSPLKDVIILYYYQELDVKIEIARVLEVPEGTVRSRLHRARKIEKELGREGLTWTIRFNPSRRESTDDSKTSKSPRSCVNAHWPGFNNPAEKSASDNRSPGQPPPVCP